MPQQSGSKGNPAHKRMSNAGLKAKRQNSWNAGKKRKDARKAAQREREAANRATVREGGLTPWELAKWKRRQSRTRKVASGE